MLKEDKDIKEEKSERDKPIVADGTVPHVIKEEPMAVEDVHKTSSGSPAEKSLGPQPSEQTDELQKKSSDEIQRAIKNDQQAKIPLKKREMKRTEDFDTRCGSGGSSIIVRNPAVAAVKETQAASEENGVNSEKLNGDVSPSIVMEGEAKQKETQHAPSEHPQADTLVKEAKNQLPHSRKPEEQEKDEDTQSKEEPVKTDEQKTTTEESMEVDKLEKSSSHKETAVIKGDQEPSKQEATEKSSKPEAVQLPADKAMSEKAPRRDVPVESSEPPPTTIKPEESSAMETINESESEKHKMSVLNESLPCHEEKSEGTEDQEMKDLSDHTNETNASVLKENADTSKEVIKSPAPEETKTSTSLEAQGSSTHNSDKSTVNDETVKGIALQERNEPPSEETKTDRNPVDGASFTTAQDSASEDHKPDSLKKTEEQQLPEKTKLPDNKDSEGSGDLTDAKKVSPKDVHISKEKEESPSPEEKSPSEPSEKTVLSDEANNQKEDTDGKTDEAVTPETDQGSKESGTTASGKESAIGEVSCKQPESPPSCKESKTESRDKNEAKEVTTKDTKPSQVFPASEEGVTLKTGDPGTGKDASSNGTSMDCDAESQKEACKKTDEQEGSSDGDKPSKESKLSEESNSDDSPREEKKDGSEQKSVSEETTVTCDTPEGKKSQENQEEDRNEREANKDAENSNVPSKVPPQGLRLKIKVPAHRRKAGLQREVVKADSESEASEGRCLRRSPRICRPTVKIVEIQDRKVEKKPVTPSTEKDKDENEEKEEEETVVQKKPRERKLDPENQSKPKVCVRICCSVLLN